MQSKLSPCPFCGGEAQLEQTGNKQITIRCQSCPAQMVQKALRYSLEWLEESMTKNWNKRAAQQGGKVLDYVGEYVREKKLPKFEQAALLHEFSLWVDKKAAQQGGESDDLTEEQKMVNSLLENVAALKAAGKFAGE